MNDKLVDDTPKNWDELIKHFKQLQMELDANRDEIEWLRTQVEFYRGRADALEEALRIVAGGKNGKRKDRG